MDTGAHTHLYRVSSGDTQKSCLLLIWTTFCCRVIGKMTHHNCSRDITNIVIMRLITENESSAGIGTWIAGGRGHDSDEHRRTIFDGLIYYGRHSMECGGGGRRQDHEEVRGTLGGEESISFLETGSQDKEEGGILLRMTVSAYSEGIITQKGCDTDCIRSRGRLRQFSDGLSGSDVKRERDRVRLLQLIVCEVCVVSIGLIRYTKVGVRGHNITVNGS
ncbi:hypothetical protein Tco_0773068 [Tanacetum coccineum]|uniref:Uncharacterized protein n=1 Tax=Tanacetum coccineum TaxID=301880 RepID=A0ABQ4ZNG0_9ASTR